MNQAADTRPTRPAVTPVPAPLRVSPTHRLPRRRTAARVVWAATALTGGALLLSACGAGATSGGSAYGAAPSGSAKASGAATVDLRGSDHGQILVDGKGRTLYLFEGDKGGKSSCSGSCATLWPPYLTSGSPQAGAGVTAHLLGTTPGADTGTQVTYAGHPLYYFSGDSAPGDTTGQGLDDFGATWYVVAHNGSAVDDD